MPLTTRELVLALLGAEDRHVDPVVLDHLLESADDFFWQATHRVLEPDPASDTDPPVAKTFRALGTEVRIPDLREADSVVLDGVELTEHEGFEIEPHPSLGEPSTHLRLLERTTYPDNGVLIVTGWWGFNPPPPFVRKAAADLVIRWLKERNMNYADAMVTPEGMQFSYFRQLPATVQTAITRLRVPRFALV